MGNGQAASSLAHYSQGSLFGCSTFCDTPAPPMDQQCYRYDKIWVGCMSLAGCHLPAGPPILDSSPCASFGVARVSIVRRRKKQHMPPQGAGPSCQSPTTLVNLSHSVVFPRNSLFGRVQTSQHLHDHGRRCPCCYACRAARDRRVRRLLNLRLRQRHQTKIAV